jgi:hypothetical protein
MSAISIVKGRAKFKKISPLVLNLLNKDIPFITFTLNTLQP